MELKNYIWNIYEIAKANNVARDVARDMFFANMELGTDKYKGATNVSYRRIGLKWKALSASQKHHEKEEFNRITKEYLKPLSQAWQAKDKKAFDAVIAGA